MLAYKKAGNEYKMTAFHLGPEQFCKYLQNMSVLYDEVLEVSDLPAKGVCPWPKKKFNVNGFSVPLDKIPDTMDGDWMLEWRILDRQKLINGYQFYLTIIRV